MKINRKLVTAIAMTAIVMLSIFGIVLSQMTGVWRDRVDEYSNISVQEAYALLHSAYYWSYGTNSPPPTAQIIVIDVSNKSEYAEHHIEGAINIPVQEDVGTLPGGDLYNNLTMTDPEHGVLAGNENNLIIVTCHHGCRSPIASEMLAEFGFNYVYNMVGGIDMWIAGGGPYPVVSGGAPPPAGTFGYSVIGGSSGWWGPGNAMWGCKFTSPSNGGTITKISAYVAAHPTYNSGGTTNMKAFVYADNGGAPGALLATSSQVSVGITPSWVDFSTTYAFSASTVYWLMVMSQYTHYVWWTSGSTSQMIFSRIYTYPNAPNAWGTSNTHMDWQMSIYATYTTP